jgi:hypothetical protein
LKLINTQFESKKPGKIENCRKMFLKLLSKKNRKLAETSNSGRTGILRHFFGRKNYMQVPELVWIRLGSMDINQ